MLTGRVNAPEINTAYGWLNTDRSWSIRDFRDKIVLLDFWTFGCINCQHIVPDLKKLEQEFADVLVVVGVHSAKFEAEKQHEAIRQAILKFGIEHPVVNDADFHVWNQYGVRAWPTLVLIDPNGKVVGQHAGEGVYDTVGPYIRKMKEEFAEKLNHEPLVFRKEQREQSVLSFPSKLISDKDGNIYLSDSGHNRILKLDQQGRVLEIIGSGKAGFTNGTYQEASFHEPHGLALYQNCLYVADAKNNAIRKIDLAQQQVTTVAGTGKLSYYFFNDSIGANVNPNSPWDLLVVDDDMYIASAGNHQILCMDLKTSKVQRYAGSGREALADGSLREAAFNQPSGLTQSDSLLVVADAEASAIRVINRKAGMVETKVGKGLFEFGDRDGLAEDALLQHCAGVEAIDSNIYIADTYNGKIKVLDLDRNRLHTLATGFQEPNDVLFLHGKLWVTSTNSHQLFKVDLNTGEKEEVPVQLPT